MIRLGNRLVDKDRQATPWMPPIQELAETGTVGVIKPGCTTGDGRIRALTTAPRIKPTSIFLRSARRPNPSRGSTYQRGIVVQKRGTSSKGSTLFCTTFPCHNCTKHILAAGIKKVIYMEPYPKSKAKQLHQNEIEIEKVTPGRVSFIPFLGISPLRYRDIFQKGKRKGADGTAKRWMSAPPAPMIEANSSAYIDQEADEWATLFVRIDPNLKAPAVEEDPAAKTA